MHAIFTNIRLYSRLRKQRGAALMVMLVIIIIGSAAFLVSALSRAGLQIERNRITADALAQAKEALISYSTSLKLTSSGSARPGDLPCPDNHPLGDIYVGTPSAPCSGNAIGRLPWKSLGLPDLRDSNNERLWYAVSANFKNNPRSILLNSDTTGTITVRDSSGNIINNGCTTGGPTCPAPSASDAPFGTGAVAIIMAPGNVLERQGGYQQDRSSAGYNTPSNYLDIVASVEDNANFGDSTSNGFIQGNVKDITGKIILNDQITSITQDNIMQSIQKRVAGEVKNCLEDYASLNNGRYPWAVPLTDLSTYKDQSILLFGRIPDDMTNTQNDSGGVMTMQWGGNCNTHSNNMPSSWWKQWRELVFYGLADAYKPVNPPNIPAANSCTVGTCLSVNPPSAAVNKKYVVIVAGKMLATQNNRPTNKTTLSNYLEPPNNSSGTTTFSQGTLSTTFNDTVVYQQ